MMRYQGIKKNFTLQEIRNREGDVIGSCVGILVGKKVGLHCGILSGSQGVSNVSF